MCEDCCGPCWGHKRSDGSWLYIDASYDNWRAE